MSPASVLTPSRSNCAVDCLYLVWRGCERCLASPECITSDAVVPALEGMLQEAR
jgi:hypothetical protein